jgi:hypothetical protein
MAGAGPIYRSGGRLPSTLDLHDSIRPPHRSTQDHSEEE